MSAAPLDDTLEVVWRALHRRYGASSRPVASVHLDELTRDEQVALAELLREPKLRQAPTRIRTATLAAALGTDPDGLRNLVAARLGQLGDRRAARESNEAAKQAARAELAAAAGHDPRLAAWAARQATGAGDDLVGRAAAARQVLDVVRTHRDVPVPLPVVAAKAFGDPHALDLDRDAGRMLVTALHERSGASPGSPPPPATERRRLLRDVGIVADELSSTVIVYRLEQHPSHPLATALSEHEPGAVTLGQLLRHPMMPVVSGPVLVVENPAVVSAASLARSDLPLVCTSGVPSVAALELVRQLRRAGIVVRAHGDFDAGGLVTVAQLVNAGAVPWRMTVEDYQLAASRSACLLEREPADVAWEPQLAAAIRRTGRVGFEEHLLDVLLEPDRI